MRELLLGIKDREVASEAREVLGGLGVGTKVVHTWRDIQRVIRADGISNFEAVVLDSRLIGRSPRSAERLADRIRKGSSARPFLITYMAEPLQSITDGRVKALIQRSDYVSATPRAVYLAIRSMKKYGTPQSLAACR